MCERASNCQNEGLEHRGKKKIVGHVSNSKEASPIAGKYSIVVWQVAVGRSNFLLLTEDVIKPNLVKKSQLLLR